MEQSQNSGIETRGKIESIQTTALLKSAKIHRKSTGDLKGLAVTQPPVKNHQFKLVGKNQIKWKFLFFTCVLIRGSTLYNKSNIKQNKVYFLSICVFKCFIT